MVDIDDLEDLLMNLGNLPPEEIERIQRNVSDDLRKQLSESLVGIDSRTLEACKEIAISLKALSQKISEKRGNLFESHWSLTHSTFSKSAFVQEQLYGKNDGAGLFVQISKSISDELVKSVKNYDAIPSVFECFIKGVLTDESSDEFAEAFDRAKDEEGEFSAEEFKRNVKEKEGKKDNGKNWKDLQTSVTEAVNCTKDSVQTMNNTYLTLKIGLAANLAKIYDAIAAYNQHLQDRFIKNENEENKKRSALEMLMDPNKRERSAYVKVRLIEDNPLLTDVLLNFIEDIPEYRERTVGSGRKKEKIKEISSFAVEAASEKLVALSDERLLGYLEDPKEFFQFIGRNLKMFDEIFQYFEEDHKRMLSSPLFKISSSNPSTIDNIIYGDSKDISRTIRKVTNADFDNIIQHTDDILPDNKKEIEHFQLREKLMLHLYQSMKKISRRYRPETKEQLAKEAIEKAVEIKYEIKDVLTSFNQRRLRRDKQLDNEYYTGMQGDIGKFFFMRKPTPRAKIENVIGKSFDRSKEHLNEIIETGNYPRLMQLSAPGGKVKSNILLIGPYGCGKTELARAICADPRVIGASVSVAGTLTAYMHESVNNVKRIYDAAKELRSNAREMKPVALCLDEFDSWFSRGHGTYSDKDMQQIENVLLEVLDGMEDYNGIITIAMTNKPKEVPKGIIRRFRYMDIVGQLTEEERKKILKMYLETTMPSNDLEDEYTQWARKLDDAPEM